MSGLQTKLTRKTVWTVAEFAEYTGLSIGQARRRLKVYDDALHGMLLKKIGGPRGWEFRPAALAKHDPEIFERLDTVEIRLDEAEERLETGERQLAAMISQTARNTNDIAKMRRGARAA